jgi:hypothetical protein
VGRFITCEIDASSLAYILRTDIHHHHPLAYSSEEVGKLQILCGEYKRLVKDKNLLENQLYDVVSKYFPLVLTLLKKKVIRLFTDLFCTLLRIGSSRKPPMMNLKSF